jgi:hypothetical protein
MRREAAASDDKRERVQTTIVERMSAFVKAHRGAGAAPESLPGAVDIAPRAGKKFAQGQYNRASRRIERRSSSETPNACGARSWGLLFRTDQPD